MAGARNPKDFWRSIMQMFKSVVAVAAALVSGSALAGLPPTSVPIDSPWALGGLAVVAAVAAARVLKSRKR
ncbi:MAG: hypothetical protein KDG50_14720 [Chromatiales bacterium]|nr:hypothetical protein [Chromatiales bacterium]